MKYWQQAFSIGDMARFFTSKTREAYQAKVAELARYEFNLANIKQVQSDLASSMLVSLDDSIVQLFDSFCSQYWDEASNNVHYYNGWKTNKAYRVNSKVITGSTRGAGVEHLPALQRQRAPWRTSGRGSLTSMGKCSSPN
ncbi:DUF4942 domain-containing protein [Rhodococcus sp. NPDC059969]|uniref:DUF4942 domain-containing protein n=1 Tax=Rhodococcus sp. NPDC059969 TaxID=3347018 RepID=UPI00366CCC6C